LAVQVPLDPQGGKLVGDNSEFPTRRISDAAVRSVAEYFRRGLVLVAVTERTKSPFHLNAGFYEVTGTSATVSGDDNPPTRDGVFSQFRQVILLTQLETLCS
jgi:hypothetical protein